MSDKKFKGLKNKLLKLHNVITDRNDTLEDLEKSFLETDFSEEDFIHSSHCLSCKHFNKPELIEPKKIIFLDIDGVLNSTCGLMKRGGQGYVDLHSEHIEVLKWILSKTKANIVISSTWRLGKTVKELKDLFYVYGIPSKYIIDKTKRFAGKPRGSEIKDWLDNTKEEIESFVILDDDSDMEPLMENLVLTNNNYGLTYLEASDAVCHLNNWWWYPDWNNKKKTPDHKNLFSEKL